MMRSPLPQPSAVLLAGSDEEDGSDEDDMDEADDGVSSRSVDSY
jgi:hypothetical protein